jgi:hypothetical protein
MFKERKEIIEKLIIVIQKNSFERISEKGSFTPLFLSISPMPDLSKNWSTLIAWKNLDNNDFRTNPRKIPEMKMIADMRMSGRK